MGRAMALTVVMVMAGLAAGGCSRTLVKGEVVYHYAWGPADGPEATLTALEGSKTIADFYREAAAEDDFCDPAIATAASLEIAGGLRAFTRATLPRVASASGWDGSDQVVEMQLGATTRASFSQPSTATDPPLTLTGASGDGSAALTVTIAVETWCGEVWK